ncbi:hypothetical protein, partial [Salmonella sp. s54925]|uniref:hypothetical protein n=1 Tax=Salmonella sp. s54925 TaxID=3159674 RepID=UPI00398097AF
TITQQFEVDKYNKTKMVGQSMQSVTTPVNVAKDDGGKKPGFRLDFSPIGSYLFGDEPERECSAKKPCKKKGTYCSKSDWQCQPTGKPGSKCDQPGQCSVDGGKFA